MSLDLRKGMGAGDVECYMGKEKNESECHYQTGTGPLSIWEKKKEGMGTTLAYLPNDW